MKTIWEELDEIAETPSGAERASTANFDVWWVEGYTEVYISLNKPWSILSVEGNSFAEAASNMRAELIALAEELETLGLLERPELWKRLEALAERVLAENPPLPRPDA